MSRASMYPLPWFFICAALATLSPSAVADDQPEPARELPVAVVRTVDFERDVAPILTANCTRCHGEKKQKGDLRVDRRASLLRGGESGEPAIQVGRSAKSLLITAVAGLDPDLVMPPKGRRLSPREIGVLRAWIDQGAKMPAAASASEVFQSDHWSFQPLASTSPPAADDPWVRNGIDAFVLRELKKRGLPPSPPASRDVLLRRVHLVMHGLAPSYEEIQAFVEARDPFAYERWVETVLSSPRYGERWARHWLDIVRFGETHGFETNRERPNAWRFRDYVIGALNSDKPYDRFVTEQIVGDQLGVPVATGFLVGGPYDLVKSPDINLTLMQRQDELADVVNTTGTTFLGLTLGCARCHNHKFDPITQRDYYAVQAVFAGVNHGEREIPAAAGREQTLAVAEREAVELRRKLARFIPPAKTRRPPVNSRRNVEDIAPVRAKFVRFTIDATTGGEPCIDELEIWSGKRNVALAKSGAKATSSSNLPGYQIHKLAHINDGRYGNGRSWISNEKGKGWVQLELARIETIDRIEWGRDRELKYKDRLATDYTIEAATEPGKWRTIASSADRAPYGSGQTTVSYKFDLASPEEARQGREWLASLRRTGARIKKLREKKKIYAGVFKQPPPTHRLYRGEPLAKREVVAPDTLELFGKLDLSVDAPEAERRRRFAAWMADARNPLTARVVVNRVWQFHFGTGFVSTPSDFGKSGTRPTHPGLLDWLAGELIRADWSLKHLHRLILTSSTFRQAGAPRSRAMALDADARFLWRFPPRRLEAEAIRDGILRTSGALSLQMGGPGFSAFKVQMENVRHYFPKDAYGPTDWRRMIYMTKVRQEQDSVFGSFDCPDASQVIPTRSRSTTPLQALNLFNSQFVLEQADIFAERLVREVGKDNALQVRRGFQRALGRSPAPAELQAGTRLVEEFGLPAFCRALLNANEFLLIP